MKNINLTFQTKAQVAGQILIYILAIIIFSMTLLYGYKAVNYFNDRSTEISYAQLEKEVNKEIKKAEGDTKGTVKKVVFSIPGNYDDVCFVKSYPSFPSSIPTQYLLINDHILTGADDKNMFLAPIGDTNFYIGDIDVINISGSECVPIVGSKITLRLESMGDHVMVSKWN